MTLVGRGLRVLGNTAAIPLCAALAVQPPPRRYAAACRLARAIEPLVRLRLRYSVRTDGYREESLHYLADRMTRWGIEFQPLIQVEGTETLGAEGALLVTGHFHMNRLFIQWLHQSGYPISLVAGPPVQPLVMGTQAPLELLLNDSRVLLRIRQRVRAGGVALVALDVADARAGWRRVETATGPRFVSAAIMRFAEQSRLPLLFCASRLGAEGQVMTRLVRPTSPHADGMLEEFCDFLCSATEEIIR